MEVQKKKPLIAAALSLLHPGLGFVYNDMYRTALFLGVLPDAAGCLCAYAGLFDRFVWLANYLLFMFGLRIFSILFNYRCSKGESPATEKPALRRILYRGIVAWILILAFGTILLPLESFTNSSTSMEAALMVGDYFMVDKSYYQGHQVQAGDVVVFTPPNVSKYFVFSPNSKWVKRVIAVGGEKVEIRDGVAYVDGERSLPSLELKRSSAAIKPRGYEDQQIYPPGAGNADQYGPIVVPQDSYFVLGDLRDNSIDSRYFGCVGKKAIIGKAVSFFGLPLRGAFR